jgi:hypothetical protein
VEIVGLIGDKEGRQAIFIRSLVPQLSGYLNNGGWPPSSAGDERSLDWPALRNLFAVAAVNLEYR